MSSDDEPLPELELADWRRQIAELYAEVRRIAATDPLAAHALWRETRERLYRDHRQSPVLASGRPAFRARHFPYDPAVRFEAVLAPVEAAAPGGPLAAALPSLPASVGDAPPTRRIGTVTLPLPGGTRRLAVFWLAEYSGGLFLPFGDTTNGSETYGAGRYLLDTAKGADLGEGASPGSLVLDFNFAYHPSCAFDPRWSCPLTPPENRLDLPIRAGERLV